MTYFSFFPSCTITKGFKNSCLIDLERASYCSIPNEQIDVLKEKFNINLKKINEGLKCEAKSHLKIIETLSEGSSIDAPWQTTSSKRTNNTNSANASTKLITNKNEKFFISHNPYEVLYVDDTREDNVNTSSDDIKTKRRKARSNRTQRMSVRNENKYNKNDYVHPKVVPGNRTYASAIKYGKKVVVIGDSHLQRINRKLFNDSLPNCRGNIRYFRGANTAQLEDYIKPTLKQNPLDAIVIHIGANDMNFRNFTEDEEVSSKAVIVAAKNIINIALLCKEYGVNEVIVLSILPKYLSLSQKLY